MFNKRQGSFRPPRHLMAFEKPFIGRYRHPVIRRPFFMSNMSGPPFIRPRLPSIHTGYWNDSMQQQGFFHPPPLLENLPVAQNPTIDFIHLWVEVVAPDGMKYYYNAQSRETRWGKPESGYVLTYAEFMSSAFDFPSEHYNSGNAFDLVSMGSMATNSVFLATQQSGTCPNESLVNMNIAPNFNSCEAFVSNNDVLPHASIVQDSYGSQTIVSPDSNPIEFTNIQGVDYTTNGIDKFDLMTQNISIIKQNVSNLNLEGNLYQSMPEHQMQKISSSFINQSNELASTEGLNNSTHNGELDTLNSRENIDLNNMEVVTKNSATKHPEGSKPVSATAVPNTKWHVVWTADGKVFYFDALLNTSVWKKPVELMYRDDVKKLTQNPPATTVLGKESQHSTSNITSEPDPKKIKVENVEPQSRLNVPKSPVIDKSKTEQLLIQTASDNSALPQATRVAKFREMLVENKVTPYSTWEKELIKIVNDPRYLLLEHKERKKVFEEYMRETIRLKGYEKRQEANDAREQFKALLQEYGTKSSSNFLDFARKYSYDARYRAIAKYSDRQKLFLEYIRDLKLSPSSKMNSSKEKQKRIAASISTRTEKVKRDLSLHLKDLERERSSHQRQVTFTNFRALLVDLIRNPSSTFKEARKVLKTDHRWESVKDMDRDAQEKLYEEHLHTLETKRRNLFRQYLSTIKTIKLNTKWKEVRKSVLSGQTIFNDEKKCEKEFKAFIEDSIVDAKWNFHDLLKETKLITHESYNLMKATSYSQSIVDVLSKDKRYLELDCMPALREYILEQYVRKLHEKGPPPPPTATLTPRPRVRS